MKLWMLLTRHIKHIKKQRDDPVLARTIDILDRFTEAYDMPIRDNDPYYWLSHEISAAIHDKSLRK